MPASHRRAALALAALLLAPAAARATDDTALPISNGPTLLGPCGAGDAPLTQAACEEAGPRRGCFPRVNRLTSTISAARSGKAHAGTATGHGFEPVDAQTNAQRGSPASRALS